MHLLGFIKRNLRRCLEINKSCADWLLFFAEPASPASGNELPVTIDHQQDPAVSSNLTRNDANCDKTGTCYDGKDNP